MRFIEEEFTMAPLYQVRGMTGWLRARDYEANAKRVRKLTDILDFRPSIPVREEVYLLLAITFPRVYISFIRSVKPGMVCGLIFLFFIIKRLH